MGFECFSVLVSHTIVIGSSSWGWGREGGSVEPSLNENFIFVGNLDKFNTFLNPHLP